MRILQINVEMILSTYEKPKAIFCHICIASCSISNVYFNSALKTPFSELHFI